MKCPVDGETLVMADRSGVEIDYCPKCRGVWLDRGELDKIIERGTPQAAAPAAAPVRQADPHRSAPQPARHYDDDDYRGQHPRKRRESFLSDLFDF